MARKVRHGLKKVTIETYKRIRRQTSVSWEYFLSDSRKPFTFFQFPGKPEEKGLNENPVILDEVWYEIKGMTENSLAMGIWVPVRKPILDEVRASINMLGL